MGGFMRFWCLLFLAGCLALAGGATPAHALDSLAGLKVPSRVRVLDPMPVADIRETRPEKPYRGRPAGAADSAHRAYNAREHPGRPAYNSRDV